MFARSSVRTASRPASAGRSMRHSAMKVAPRRLARVAQVACEQDPGQQRHRAGAAASGCCCSQVHQECFLSELGEAAATVFRTPGCLPVPRANPAAGRRRRCGRAPATAACRRAGPATRTAVAAAREALARAGAPQADDVPADEAAPRAARSTRTPSRPARRRRRWSPAAAIRARPCTSKRQRCLAQGPAERYHLAAPGVVSSAEAFSPALRAAAQARRRRRCRPADAPRWRGRRPRPPDRAASAPPAGRRGSSC